MGDQNLLHLGVSDPFGDGTLHLEIIIIVLLIRNYDIILDFLTDGVGTTGVGWNLTRWGEEPSCSICGILPQIIQMPEYLKSSLFFKKMRYFAHFFVF